MMSKQQLPLGTVVKIKGREENLMIISQFPVMTINGEQGYLDFGATTLPTGFTNQEIILFNKEDIEEIIFLGYIDAVFQQFLSESDSLVSKFPYKKLTTPRSREEKMQNETKA